MITRCKALEAAIRKYYPTLLGGVFWIDGYNNRIHKDALSTILTNVDKSNLYFFSIPSNTDETDTDKLNG